MTFVERLLGLVAAGYLGFVLPGMPLTPKQVVDRSQDKVVKIELRFKVGSASHKFVGSGAIINPDGLILTCAHLFGRAGDAVVVLPDGQQFSAQIVRVDHDLDLALIKIAPYAPLPYFKLGATPYVGQQVLAFGSPLDIQGTVSVGYIENINISSKRFTIQGAAINPGNSGGPLVDLSGRLIGVNVAILLQNVFQEAQNLGLAVNLDTICHYVAD